MSKTIATHNGGFHADDVFAVATLLLIFPDAKVVRTRDEKEIDRADIVVDVGRSNDGEKFFDHHQQGGAGVRENGISYASFGLVWKKFGEMLCDQNSVNYIDKTLVQSIDIVDNGIDFAPKLITKPFTVSDVIGSFNPIESESQDFDVSFMKAVDFAKVIIENVIKDARDISNSLKIYQEAFEKSPDKKLLVIDTKIRKEVLHTFTEVLYVVMPYHNNTWSIRAVRKSEDSFEAKKPLPELWAGKSPEELQKITGVQDVIFCHNKSFMANAKSKEGAIMLAHLALGLN